MSALTSSSRLAGLRSAAAVRRPAGGFLRRSRALASLLPAFIYSGVLTLVVTAAAQLSWAGPTHDFLSAWMEGWLVAWPIAFPVAYLLGPVVARVGRIAGMDDRPMTGLDFASISDASARADARHGLSARRPLRSPHRTMA